MKNLLIGVFLGFLIGSVWYGHVSAAQAVKKPAQIWVGTDLQVGMPKETVIAKVTEAGYEIKRITSDADDTWSVTKKNEKNEYDLIGTVSFSSGKLEGANHILYDSFDEPAAKFARNLYFVVRDLEAEHNNVCSLESKNQENANSSYKAGILHCGNRMISTSVSKYRDQDGEGQLSETVK